MANAKKEKSGRIVLVGTYRGDQLTKWRGWYCYPVESVKCRVESVKCGERGTGNGERETGNGEWGTGNGRARSPSAPQSPANSSTTSTYPLSIFPESEQRRIAADFGQPRVPVAVKRAIAGAEKAMARSRKRAEKGLCTKEESEAFCTKSATALRNYLDKQVKEGVITTTERKALGTY